MTELLCYDLANIPVPATGARTRHPEQLSDAQILELDDLCECVSIQAHCKGQRMNTKVVNSGLQIMLAHEWLAVAL